LPEVNSYFRDPVGDWRKSINITDWDPSDTIAIRVDPTNAASNRLNRWGNIQFQFARGINNSSFDGSELVISTANGGNNQPIIRLEEFGGSPGGFAWHAYDFLNKRQRIIGSQSTDMAFFGQIPLGSDVTHPGGRDRYNFDVSSGSRIFRWTDRQGLTNAQLSQMQSASENILLEHDTMAFGYYTELKFSRLNESQTLRLNQKFELLNPSIDLDESKLWIRELPSVNAIDSGAPIDWTAYTFRQMEIDPKAQAYKRLATPVWARVTGGSPLSVSVSSSSQDKEVSTLDRIGALVEGFELLDQLLPGDLPSLKLTEERRADELTGTRLDHLVIDNSDLILKDLNTVQGIAIDPSKTSVVVYYEAFTDSPESPWALLKTRIQDGLSYGVYGLTTAEIAAEERITGLDLNADNVLG
jgi:hypothetical protein